MERWHRHSDVVVHRILGEHSCTVIVRFTLSSVTTIDPSADHLDRHLHILVVHSLHYPYSSHGLALFEEHIAESTSQLLESNQFATKSAARETRPSRVRIFLGGRLQRKPYATS